jgi:hypothetical protein
MMRATRCASYSVLLGGSAGRLPRALDGARQPAGGFSRSDAARHLVVLERRDLVAPAGRALVDLLDPAARSAALAAGAARRRLGRGRVPLRGRFDPRRAPASQRRSEPRGLVRVEACRDGDPSAVVLLRAGDAEDEPVEGPNSTGRFAGGGRTVG